MKFLKSQRLDYLSLLLISSLQIIIHHKADRQIHYVELYTVCIIAFTGM